MTTRPMPSEELISAVCNCAFCVRLKLNKGYVESVYQNALMIELASRGIRAEAEVPLTVTYKEQVVGVFRADIIVEDCLLVELKAVSELIDLHDVQVVNYLQATGIEIGLLINFGGDKIEFHKKFRTYRAKAANERS